MTQIFRRIIKSHSKHKKLAEEWALADCEEERWWSEGAGAAAECSSEARYVGAAPLERACSAPATALAVRSALHTSKAGHKKQQRVKLTISTKGVVVADADTEENILNLSIYRISYCSADASLPRVFAVVEGSAATAGSYGAAEAHRAHVFVCSRRRHARAFALSLAHAFNDAYQAWQASQATSMKRSALENPAPWVSFPEESEEGSRTAWESPTQLVSFI